MSKPHQQSYILPKENDDPDVALSMIKKSELESPMDENQFLSKKTKT